MSTLVHNATPFPWGRLVTSRRPPALEMAVVVRGTFDVVADGTCTVAPDPEVQGVVGGELLAPGDHPALAAPLAPNDLVPYKLNAEVLVVGSCTAPGGRPVAELPVEVRVGRWSKGLTAVGRRAYSDGGGGGVASQPLPFTTMPLHLGVAYGGPGYAANPAGAGIASSEAPNLEWPGERLATRGSRPAAGPASLGALNPRWPDRAARLGASYGPIWRKTRAPWPAEDFDWTFFHQAPADQQLTGYLRGDEEVILTNLHPELPRVKTRLPGVRPRVLVRFAGGAEREVQLSLDTLVVVADEGRLRLTWRGLVDVAEDDLEDVEALLLTSDPIDATRPIAQLRDELDQARAAAIPGASAEDEARRAEAEARFARIDAAAAAAQKGDQPPADALAAQLVAPLDPADPRTGDAAARIRSALGEHDAHVPPGKSRLGEMVPPADRPPSPPPLRDLVPGEAPMLAPNRKLAKGIDDAIAEVRAARPELDRDTSKRGAEARAPLGNLEALKQDPQWRAVFKPRVEPGPRRDLSDQDLEGEDLRGADLEGANLEGTILTRADLTGARLRGARLTSAVLFQAVLDGADLDETTLTLTNLAEARGRGTSFRGAALDRTFFEDARLPEAVFARCTGAGGFFERTDLDRADFEGAAIERSLFEGARLEGARFVGATLTRVSFDRCELAGASFEGARLVGATWLACRAPRAVFVRAEGQGASLQETQLDGADFSLAVLPGVLLPKASLTGAVFFGADLRGARMPRARLDRASFERANLLDADLRKVTCGGAIFRRATLHAANLLGASGRGADFAGADLSRCQIEGLA